MFSFARNRKSPAQPDADDGLTTKGDYGLEICHEDDQAVADIVFVHGLTGNRRSTWTCKSANVFWPKDLLPRDLPRTRIMTYGYDADIAHFWAMASQNRIGEHAGNLVNALTQIRERTDTEGRPIVFVTHSLGGLVTEDALLFSKNSAESHLQDVIHSVVGICFLGTPHCGSDLARWGSVAGSLVNAVKTANVELVNVLKPDSEVLARVQREFHSMLRALARDTSTTLDICCFFEELPVRGAGEIVPKHSAILPSYNAIGIRANHMDMTKFAGSADGGYLAVSSELRRWIKAIMKRENAERTRSESNFDPYGEPIYSQPGTYPRSRPDEPAFARGAGFPPRERSPNPAAAYGGYSSPYESARPYGGHSPAPYAPPPPEHYPPYGGPEYRNPYAPRYSPHGQVGGYVRPPPPPEPRYIEDAEQYPPRFDPRQRSGHSAQEDRDPSPPSIYQGANVFSGPTQTQAGGRTLQGNFNGNITFN